MGECLDELGRSLGGTLGVFWTLAFVTYQEKYMPPHLYRLLGVGQ